MLYIRQGIKLEPLLQGGGQEFGTRSSTVNVPAVLGFSKAVSIYKNERKNERKRIIKMRQKIISAITAKIPDAKINGDPERGVSNILSISFKNTDGQLLAMQLDRKGIAVSTGSSCSSGKVETSRILKACKIDRRWIGGTIRISLGRFTNQDEVDYLINILPETVYEIRKVS
jgi:cysteine desulfurase